MALAGLRHSWLLALADPSGPAAVLPEKRLRPWDLAAVCDLADRHGVLPTVLANLRQVAAREGPARAVRISGNVDDKAILADAEKSVLRQTGLAMLLRRQAAEATAALARASVPVLVLKGPEFADRLYPQPAARLFTDIDLFIPQAAGDAAEGVMRDLGYVPTVSSMKYEEGYGERGWRRPSARTGVASGLVEVHWNLVNSPTLRRVVSVEFADLQLETAPGRSGGPRMTAASLLLVAAVHGATSHGFDKLRMLYDVAQTVRGAPGRWTRRGSAARSPQPAPRWPWRRPCA